MCTAGFCAFLSPTIMFLLDWIMAQAGNSIAASLFLYYAGMQSILKLQWRSQSSARR